MGDPLSAEPVSEALPAADHKGPVTLGQASWALMFVAIYVAVATGGILVLGATGVIGFTLELLLPAALTGITAAVFLALYIHLFRRNKLTPADLGVRRPTRRMFHLFWQAPAVIIVCAGLQLLFLGLLSLMDVDTSTAGSSSGVLADIGRLPVLSAVIVVLVIAVFTPLWEEVLFRGAFLDGLSGRFRPAVAIALSAAIFAAAHMFFPLNFVYLFTVGIALALLRRFHQNLWAPVIVHAVNNGLVTLIAISFVQSGG
jgi:membrane protease YdiL (CAAX protease family)